MLPESFYMLFWREFESIKAGADYFHVRETTVRRWLYQPDKYPPNPCAEKLLVIKARGYLPNDTRLSGWTFDEHRLVMRTPEGREFNIKELESLPVWIDEYVEYRHLYGPLPRKPQPQPPREYGKDFGYGFRGNQPRDKPAP